MSLAAPARVPALAAALLLAASAVRAQDVQYRSVSSLDMGTGMNVALRFAGASQMEQTTFIKGRKMRTDAAHQSTIYDLERSRVIVIDQDRKTYVTAPLSQLTAAVTQLSSGADVRADAGAMKGSARDSAGNRADFTVHVTMEPTSEHAEVGGQDARRSFATVQTDVQVTPQGESKATDAGTLVILLDSWNASGGPAYAAVHAFQQAMSRQLRDQVFAGAKGPGAAGALDPRVGEAMKRAAAEEQKIDGLPMRTVMYLVIVPPSRTFDRALAIAPADDGGAKGAAKRALGGMFGGALRRGKAEEKPAADSAHQVTFMKMTTEIQDVQTASLPASLFEAPAGYREVPFTPPARH